MASPPPPTDLNLTPLQTLQLFKMLFTGEEPAISKSGIAIKDRKALEAAGLIILEKRKGPKGPGANHIVLTDRAWHWASEHLDAPCSITINGARALAGLLPRLKGFMERRQVALADILAPAPADVSPAPVPVAPLAPHAPLEERIVQTSLEIAGGARKTRVRLAALRERLADIPRDDLDRALVQLQSERKLTLYRLDDPAEIGPDDQAAALMLGEQPRHILYLGDGS